MKKLILTIVVCLMSLNVARASTTYEFTGDLFTNQSSIFGLSDSDGEDAFFSGSGLTLFNGAFSATLVFDPFQAPVATSNGPTTSIGIYFFESLTVSVGNRTFNPENGFISVVDGVPGLANDNLGIDFRDPFTFADGLTISNFFISNTTPNVGTDLTNIDAININRWNEFSFDLATSADGVFSLDGGACSIDGLDCQGGILNTQLTAISGAIPEPATWLMMIIGFAGVGFAAKRRRSAVDA